MVAWIRAEGVTRDRIEEKEAKMEMDCFVEKCIKNHRHWYWSGTTKKINGRFITQWICRFCGGIK